MLLDPRNITVATGGTATLAQVDEFADTPGTNQTIAPATINAAAANVMLQANNDITVTNAIAMTNSGVGITMQAGRDIRVNAGISTTNGNISLPLTIRQPLIRTAPMQPRVTSPLEPGQTSARAQGILPSRSIPLVPTPSTRAASPMCVT